MCVFPSTTVTLCKCFLVETTQLLNKRWTDNKVIDTEAMWTPDTSVIGIIYSLAFLRKRQTMSLSGSKTDCFIYNRRRCKMQQCQRLFFQHANFIFQYLSILHLYLVFYAEVKNVQMCIKNLRTDCVIIYLFRLKYCLKKKRKKEKGSFKKLNHERIMRDR